MKKGLKKLPHAVLTTTMVTSIFAGSALAAQDGLYMDGNYYSINYLLKADDETFQQIVDQLSDLNFDEVFFVFDGEGGSLTDIVNDKPFANIDDVLKETWPTIYDVEQERDEDPVTGEPPVVETVLEVTDQVNEDNSVTISGTAEGAAEVEITLVDPEGNESIETVEVDEEGNFEFTSEADLAAGDWTYTVVALDEEGNELDSEEGDFTIEDVAELPVVESVSAVAGTDMKVTVTGTAKNADKVTVSVDGGAEAEATLSEDGSFTYTTDALAAGDHTVSVKAYKGEEVSEAVTKTVKVEAVAPTVESVVASDAGKLVVTFNKEVSGLTKDNFTINLQNSSTSKINVKSVKVDGNTAELELESYLAHGSTYVVTVKGLQDQTVDITKNVTFTDNTAPLISSVNVVDSKHLVLTLSERVRNNAGIDGNNFVIRNTTAGVAHGGTIAASLDDDGKTLRLDLSTALTVADYTIFYNNGGAADLVDLAGNEMPLNHGKSFVGVAGDDTIAPTVSKVTYSKISKRLSVYFDEIVDATPTSNVAVTKFSVTNGSSTVTLTASDYVTNAGDSNMVTIQLSDATAATVNALTGNLTVNWEAGAVKDLSNNPIAVGTKAVTVSNPPQVASVAYDQATDKLSITFDQDVRVASEAINQSKIKYTDNNGATSAAINANANATIETTANGKTVVFKLSAADAAALEGKTTANLELILDADAFESVDGTKNEAVTASADKKITYTADTVAPQVTSASYNDLSNVLVLSFNERVNPSTKDLTKISITDGTSTVALSSDHNVAETTASDKLTIDIGSGSAPKASNVETLDLTKAKLVIAKGAVKDVAGNEIAAVAASDNKTISYTDLSAPELATNGGWGAKVRTTNSTTVQIYFNEKLDSSTVVPANFTIYPTNNPNAPLEVKQALLGADSRTVTLVTAAQQYNLQYTVKLSENIKDVAGNKLIPTASANTSGNTFVGSASSDTTGPQLASATSATFADKDSSYSVSAGDQITVTFNEPIQVGSLTAADFSVDLDGAGGTNSLVAVTNEFGSNPSFAKGAGDNTVVITLGAGATIVPGTSYINIKNGTEAVKDLSGNNASNGITATIQKPDTTAPYLTSVAYSDTNGSGSVNQGDEVVLTFNEPVDLAAGAGFANDWFVGTPTIDGTGFAINTVPGQPNQLKLTLGSNAGNDDITFGTTTLEFVPANMDHTASPKEGIYDKWGNKVTTASTAVKYTSSDATAPTLSAVQWHDNDNDNVIDAGDQLTFEFSEAVSEDATGATLQQFYAVGGTASPSFGTNSQTLDPVAGEPKKMRVTLAGTPALYAGATKIGVDAGQTQHIQDASDNLLMYSSEVSITKATDLGTPTVTSAESLDLNNDGNVDTVKVVFNEKVKDSTFDKSKWAIAGGVTIDSLNTSVAGDTADDNTIYITVTGVTGTGAINNLTTSAAGGIQDLAGNNLANGVNQAVTDKAAPVLLKWFTQTDGTIDTSYQEAGDVIRLVFSENIVAAANSTANFDSFFEIAADGSTYDTLANIDGTTADTVGAPSTTNIDITEVGGDATALVEGTAKIRIKATPTANAYEDAVGNDVVAVINATLQDN